MAGTATYRSIAAVDQLPTIDVRSLFREPISVAPKSPVDIFIVNTNKLNTLYAPYIADPRGWLPELGNIVFLGYMSAIESYVRAIVTGLVNIDDTSRRHAGPKTVSFAIATNHRDPKLLPEALMENMSFSTAGIIEKALREIVGIEKVSVEIKATLSEFAKLCEVRHCCTHRFGKLGSQNAMYLGFEHHRLAIEHPFSPSASDMERIADVLQVTVKSLNNFIFREVLDRTVHFEFEQSAPWAWTWHFARDRKRFAQYYDHFALTQTRPSSPDLKTIYDSFRAEHSETVKARRARG